MAETMQGRRVEWTAQILEPGEFAKLPDGKWMAATPNGHGANLANHEVEEHDDGTITVSPSIMVVPAGAHPSDWWHGFLSRGVWRKCE
jgi:hypothetical protein